jgi:hypothetical protein
VALIKPKCFEVDTRRLKIDTPMVSKLVIEPKRRPSWLPTLKEPGLTRLALAAGHGESRKKAPVGVIQTEPGLKEISIGQPEGVPVRRTMVYKMLGRAARGRGSG